MLYVYEGLSYFTRESQPIAEVESTDGVVFTAPFVIVAESYAETPGLVYKAEGFKCFITSVESQDVVSLCVPLPVYLRAYLHYSEYPQTGSFPGTFEELLENDRVCQYPCVEECTSERITALLEDLHYAKTRYYYVPNEDLDLLMETLKEYGFDRISPATLYAIYTGFMNGRHFPFHVLALPCKIDAATLMYEGMYEEPEVEETAPEQPEPQEEPEESHAVLDRVLEEESRDDFEPAVNDIAVDDSTVFTTTVNAQEDSGLVFSRADEFISYVEGILEL